MGRKKPPADHVVLELVLPGAQPAYYGPGTLEACEQFKAQRDAESLPRGVTRRDLAVVKLEPLDG